MALHPVIFAGAGPGDKDLITVRLAEQLKEMDVILVDRLVNPAILEKYTSSQSFVIEVGKQAYEKGSTKQQDINDLMVSYALAGKKVMRLKGGDVAFYSNVLDEIYALQQYHIKYEIIPGITAASGAAASIGIPLTGRDLAPGVRFISLAAEQPLSDAVYAQWAGTSDTLVFYMSIAPLRNLLEKLIAHGLDQNKWIAIIEEATTNQQKNHIYPVHSFVELLNQPMEYKSPSIIILGHIVHLANDQSTQTSAGTTFKSINRLNTDIHVI